MIAFYNFNEIIEVIKSSLIPIIIPLSMLFLIFIIIAILKGGYKD